MTFHKIEDGYTYGTFIPGPDNPWGEQARDMVCHESSILSPAELAADRWGAVTFQALGMTRPDASGLDPGVTFYGLGTERQLMTVASITEEGDNNMHIPNSVELTRLVTMPIYRNRGFATSLLNWMEDICVADKITSIVAMYGDSADYEFYRKRGYKQLAPQTVIRHIA